MIKPFRRLGDMNISEILEVFKNDITENDWLEDINRSGA